MIWSSATTLSRNMDLWSLQLLFLSVTLLCTTESAILGRTSAFIRSEYPATDIPLDNEVFEIPKGYNAPEQVHITQGDYDGKAVIISWVTSSEPGKGEVSYGTAENTYDKSVQCESTNYTYYNYNSGYIHHCLVDGLEISYPGSPAGKDFLQALKQSSKTFAF